MPFTFFAVAGQVGYNVPILCWVDSVNGNHLGKSVDSYFVLSLSCRLRGNWLSKYLGGERWSLKPFRLLILDKQKNVFHTYYSSWLAYVKFLNGALVVFASKGKEHLHTFQRFLEGRSVRFVCNVNVVDESFVGDVQQCDCWHRLSSSLV